MLDPGQKIPEFKISLINGTSWKLDAQSPENFTMIVCYRGFFCSVCKSYLEDLQTKVEAFTKLGVNILAISADSKEKADQSYEEWKIKDLPIGYNFPVEEARSWGLFISEGKGEEPAEFSEPALLLIRPDQTLFYYSLQSMPFGRPDFEDILGGIKYSLKKDYPVHGKD